MIQALLIIILLLAAVCAVSVLVASAMTKRAAKAEAEAKRLHDAFWEVEGRAERLQKALNGNLKAEEEADEKRKDLAATPDSGLADRANSLFGVRDGKKRP